MSMFRRGDSLLVRRLFANGSESVTYARSSTTATVDAVIGKTEFFGGDSGSAQDRMEQRDFLIQAADLAAFTEPQEGDIITHDDVSWRVEVPDGVPKPWRYSDGSRTVMRIHCWRGYQE